MAHEVFISYSSIDRNAANAVVSGLEGMGIRCWVAPRDILPGAEWAESIIDAIGESKIMVLIFSANANNSQQILREVERAVNKRVAIIPLRIEDAEPTRSMEYFISASHWLDAMSGPIESHIEHLGKSIQAFMDPDAPRPAAPELPPTPVARRWTPVRGAIAAVAAVAIAAGTWLGISTLTGPAGPARSEIEGVPVVAVAPLVSLSDESLVWLGDGVANLVRDNLTQSRHIQVVSAQRTLELSGADDGTGLSDVAASQGIDYLFTGEIIATPGGLTATTRLTDTKGSVEIAARRLDEPDPQELLGASGQLAAAIRQGLKVPREDSVDVFAADFATANIAAYESYVAGLQYFLGYQYEDAERSFDAALQLAPDYAMARYRLAHIQAATGRTEEALATLAPALANPPPVTRQQLYLEAADAYFRRNMTEAQTAYQTLLEQYPYEIEARRIYADVLSLLAQDDAALAQLSLIEEQEPNNQVTLSKIVDLEMRNGRYGKAEIGLQQLLSLDTDSANTHVQLGDLKRITGDLVAAAEHYQQALELDPTMLPAQLSLARVDLRAGRIEDAIAKLGDLAANETALPRYRIDAAFALAHVLRAGGRFETAGDALTALEPQLAAEKVRHAMALATRGLNAVEMARFDEARVLIDEAITQSPGVPTRYLFARATLELATGDFEAAEATAAEIAEHALPPENPDRTEERAAAYLRGMAALGRQDAVTAHGHLNQAQALEGYQYALYDLGLARALLATGDKAAAAAAASRAAEPQSGEWRLDLLIDGVKAEEFLAALNSG